MNFERKPPILCRNCGKDRWVHQARTHHCPSGKKTRIGYTSFGPNTFQAEIPAQPTEKT
jgi:hypothetical protein